MRKRRLSLLIALILLFSNVIAYAGEGDLNVRSEKVVFNEYEMYKIMNEKNEKELKTLGYSKEEIKEIKELDFEKELKKRAKLDKKSLKGLGYSDEEIEILKSFKDNEHISDEIMIQVAAQVDLTLDMYMSENTNNQTWLWCTFDWSWTKAPNFIIRDAVAFSWNGDYTCLENTVSAEINFHNYKWDKDTKIDYTTKMKQGINPAENGVGFDFAMIRDLGQSWANYGKGSFVLRCSEHSHNYVQFRSAYGHGIVSITGISINWGTPAISFGWGVQTLDPEVKSYNF